MPTLIDNINDELYEVTEEDANKMCPEITKADVYAYEDYSAEELREKRIIGNIPFDDGEKKTDYPDSFVPKWQL